MYGVERSVVALIKEVGTAEGMTILELRGKLGGSDVGVVPLALGTVVLSGRSHAVYHPVNLHTPAKRN
jgi:hypothetical protein